MAARAKCPQKADHFLTSQESVSRETLGLLCLVSTSLQWISLKFYPIKLTRILWCYYNITDPGC